MHNIEFAYWLQGFFEIADASRTVTSLNNLQVDIIRNHLTLARTVDGSQDAFGTWLEMHLDKCHEFGHRHLNAKDVSTIRDELNKHFAHIVDPQYSDREKLQRIHDGLEGKKKLPPPHFEAMC